MEKEEALVSPQTESGAESTRPSSAEEAKPKEHSSSSSSSSSSSLSSSCSSSPPRLGWPIRRADLRKSSVSVTAVVEEAQDGKLTRVHELGPKKISEVEMMKERFAKLLLGEDMSGSGKGACTAMAISNSITNLCASVFGQLWRLEPLGAEKKSKWQREVEWLLCVGDQIVELIPSCQTFPDGAKLEVMTCRPRSDMFINLPALRKLDNMLLEILESFVETEFWYVDQGVVAQDSDGSASFRRSLQRQEEKWWLPVPRVPAGGLNDDSRRQLSHTRECTNQILKAAMSINGIALADMEVPESYLEALPKNGRACLGDIIYRYITSDQFSSECLLDCLDISSEHVALEIVNRVEASIYVWRRRSHSTKPPLSHHPARSTAKSSWDMVKELVTDGDKRELLAERAESLLLCLKQRFPCLTQTTLDISKIQHNKDVGKSILESYSRVLESLAFNVVARIDDLLYVDDLTRHSDNASRVTKVSVISHKKVSVSYPAVAASGTPYRTASMTPTYSPATGPPLVSPTRVGERTPFLHSTTINNVNNANNNNNKKAHRCGFGVRRVLTNYLGVDTKPRICGGGLSEGAGKENVERRVDHNVGAKLTSKKGL